jgi:hypothetical protein
MMGHAMYVFTQDVPIDSDFYARITEGLGPQPPDGLVLHLALQRPEGGLRYVDVWQSEEHCDRFIAQRLHPVIHPLLGELFGENMPPEPGRTVLPVVHAWGSTVTT